MMNQPERPSRNLVGYGLLLVVLAYATYHNTFTAPLVLDDTLNIRNNASIRQLWPPQPAEIATMRGRPVVNFSFALNYATGGLAVGGYHRLNLAIHVVAGLILMGIVHRTLLLPRIPEPFKASAQFFAFGAAAIWLLHPLQTESVTYISQRTESLMGLFYLLTLYCFVRGIGSVGKTRTWHTLAVLSCLLGMGCKEVMVTVPVAVLLYDRTFVAGTFHQAWRLRRGLYLGLAACWIVLPVLLLNLEHRGVFSGVGSWEYALTESRVVAQYLWLAIWPVNLVFDYGAEIARSLTEVWPYALLIVALIVGVVVALKRHPIIGFLLAWPFLLLAPSSSVVPVANQPMADHRMYLPLVGLAVLTTAAVHFYLGRRAWIVLCVFIAALGGLTLQRNAIYRDETTLWQDTVEKRPNNARARQNLANAHLRAGRMAEAEQEYKSSLGIEFYNPDTLINLGFVYAQTGRPARAMDLFKRVTIIMPNEVAAHYNLGCVALSLGELAEARRAFVQTIRLNPRHADAQNQFATLLVHEGRYQEAVDHFTQALAVEPANAETYAKRAHAKVQLGQLSAALEDYRQAIALKPDFEEARAQLQLLESAAGSLR